MVLLLLVLGAPLASAQVLSAATSQSPLQLKLRAQRTLLLLHNLPPLVLPLPLLPVAENPSLNQMQPMRPTPQQHQRRTPCSLLPMPPRHLTPPLALQQQLPLVAVLGVPSPMQLLLASIRIRLKRVAPLPPQLHMFPLPNAIPHPEIAPIPPSRRLPSLCKRKMQRQVQMQRTLNRYSLLLQNPPPSLLLQNPPPA